MGYASGMRGCLRGVKSALARVRTPMLGFPNGQATEMGSFGCRSSGNRKSGA
jgi:hypothetical protein